MNNSNGRKLQEFTDGQEDVYISATPQSTIYPFNEDVLDIVVTNTKWIWKTWKKDHRKIKTIINDL